MRHLFTPIAALLLSDAVLLMGHGLQLTVLPLHGALEGFSDTEVALTGSSYFLGFVAGCLLAPRVVRRVGHIRSFAVLTSLFSALVLVFPMLPTFWVWLVLRALTGACISGLYMIMESWLNERAARETRGLVLSVYTFINLSMIMVGQQLINVAAPGSMVPFACAAILLSLAIVPVSLTSALAPTPPTQVRIDLFAVWQLSRVGMAGALAAGLATGAFWGLGPVYGRDIGLDTRGITLLMSAGVLGGALFQLPLGRLSDHLDRRVVMLGTALVGAALAAVLNGLDAARGAVLGLLVFLWGGTTMTLFALCQAHANDRAQPEQYVMVSSSLLITFGTASAFGPALASAFMAVLGPGGLFGASAVVLAMLVAGILRRRRTHYLPLRDRTVPFRPILDTSPALFELDPRSESAAVPEPEREPERQDDARTQSTA